MTDAPKFTPGPWTAEKAVDTHGFETGKLWIIMGQQPCAYDFDRWEDAQLAAAAPEMYEALKASAELSEMCMRVFSANGMWPELHAQAKIVQDAVRAALAKAVQP